MPSHSPTVAEQQGFGKNETVTIDAKKWAAMRRQMIRIVLGWRYADKEIARVIEHCRHSDGCPAVQDRTTPCLPSCPDREIFLSALVIKHNAEQYAMLQRDLPLRIEGDFHPPGREYFDVIVSELIVLQEGRDILAEVQAAIDKNVSPWGEVQAEPVEQPLTRMLPVSQEDEEVDEDLGEDDEEGPPSSSDGPGMPGMTEEGTP
jgi:hypothetical protein